MSLNALYVDFNSYFASVEQQLVPELRGKPIGVLAVMAETTCCIAASYEAKAFGIKTGTLVREARKLCPDIIFVEARPPVYVAFHHKLIEIVESCTHVEKVLSIDEMVCKLTGSQQVRENALILAAKIKQKICAQFEYIRCSIGIAPNTFLAKTASNMQKPDGCVVIESHELPQRIFHLKLRDLNGVGRQMEARLARYKITTVEQLYAANRQQLQTAWGSIEGERMYDKLRGLEPYYVKNARSSLGHSHVLPPEQRNQVGAKAVMHRLLQKACMRMRSYDLLTSKIGIKVKFRDMPSWNAESAISPTDNTLRLIEVLETFWQRYPKTKHAPYAVGISFSGLVTADEVARDLFQIEPLENEKKLNKAIDTLNLKFGKNTIYFGGAHEALKDAPMRIAFSHIPDLVVEGDE
ncbi:DNA polymerase [Methylotenera sp.]|uniref:DNA polymerase Y family protein n=1 Tax=Methylotenera sp. TaxID=2051956 RepID=UPI002723560F|nr:DNA polymerase [Methylotenera sp.]MDO9205302.1 DNA polymerase [Methylotenera sp.]MDO9393837.1 DNA polymerase [Methylotenera sp.]MDP1522138.1 DNA polymerase [Methylotenera sp.]MDP2072313.1 DNA polymerase [Methylotenera sp.]MDP2231068.1 DNA polymerase [Methylotenera sp.]